MSELTNERLRQILADCEGVTPGPWKAWDNIKKCCVFSETDSLRETEPHVLTARLVADARHLANFDPDTVRALVEELLKARDGLETARVHELDDADTVKRLRAERDALRAEVERLTARLACYEAGTGGPND